MKASNTGVGSVRSLLRAAFGSVFLLPAVAPSLAEGVEGRFTLTETGRATIAEEGPRTRLSNSVGALAFSPDGSTLAVGLQDPNTILLVDPATLAVRKRLTGHLAMVSRLAFLPDGKTLASAGHDGTIRLWNLADGGERLLIDQFQERVRGLAVSPDGERIYSGEMGVQVQGKVQAWNAGDGKLLGSFRSADHAIADLALSPDGKTLATTSRQGTIRIWDAATFEPRKEFKDETAYSNSIGFTPDGRALAAAFFKDATLRMFDVATMRERWRVETGAPFFLTLDVSPDGATVATADVAGGRIRLWSATDGELLADHSDDAGMEAVAIRFASDGRALAVGGSSGALRTLRLGRPGD